MKFKIVLIVLFYLFSMRSYSQVDSLGGLDSSRIVHLEDLVFSVYKEEQKKSDQAQYVQVILQKDIQLLNPQTSSDMLINTGSVFVQKSQQGGGSPSIRGFEASRVLLVVDGIRMNNAIYRAGHLQDVITIDNNLLERTEILFGPSSTMYGSDALGGVMHFFTRKPYLLDLTTKKFQWHAYTRWSSSNNEATSHLDLNIAGKKFGSLTGATFSKFDDLHSGRSKNPFFDTIFGRREYIERINGIDSVVKNNKPSRQINSGYNQLDLFQKFSFKQNEKILHILNLQYSSSSDIPRYDRLSEYSKGQLRFAEWYYGPQKRFLAALQSEIKSETYFDHLNISLAFQNIDQHRVSRLFRNENRLSQIENVKVYSLNMDAGKNINDKNRLGYGLEIVHNRVGSVANNFNIVTDSFSLSATRYPDGGSTMNNYAAYINHQGSFNSKFKIHDGIRFSFSSLQSKFINQTFFPFPFSEINQNNKALTGNLGIVYEINKASRFSLLGSTGFRTPNIDDLTKIFESTKGNLIIANPDLKPEYTINFEVGFDYSFSRQHNFSIQAWNTFLQEALVLKNFKYQGQDSVDYLGTRSQVQAMQNVDRAYIRGVSTTYSVQFYEYYTLLSTFTYTYGKYKDIEKGSIIPLDHISPIFGKTGIKFNKKHLQCEFYSLYNGWKRLKDYSPSGEDNLQYATSIGMPAWFTLNIKASFKVGEEATVQAGVENILDTHYRYFASGISAAGRNVYITLRAKL